MFRLFELKKIKGKIKIKKINLTFSLKFRNFRVVIRLAHKTRKPKIINISFFTSIHSRPILS